MLSFFLPLNKKKKKKKLVSVSAFRNRIRFDYLWYSVISKLCVFYIVLNECFGNKNSAVNL